MDGWMQWNGMNFIARPTEMVAEEKLDGDDGPASHLIYVLSKNGGRICFLRYRKIFTSTVQVKDLN